MRTAAHVASALTAVAIAGMMSLPANAQTDRPQRQNPIHVQIGINFFVAGPTDDSKDAIINRDNARRQIYDMAGKECELLRATIAAECSLEAISVNINRQIGRQTPEGYNVNGSVSYQVMQK